MFGNGNCCWIIIILLLLCTCGCGGLGDVFDNNNCRCNNSCC